MRIVGLTGGIACGKSAVSTAAASWGLRVIDMDEIARRVVCPGLPAYTDIVAAFGDGALLPSGELNRTEVGRIAFSDREKRRALNAATHRPMLMQLLAELAAALFGGEAAVLIDAPLLFETSLHWLCCTTLVVAVAEATQPERLRKAVCVRLSHYDIIGDPAGEAASARRLQRGGGGEADCGADAARGEVRSCRRRD